MEKNKTIQNPVQQFAIKGYVMLQDLQRISSLLPYNPDLAPSDYSIFFRWLLFTFYVIDSNIIWSTVL